MPSLETLNKISQRNFGLDLNGGLRLITGINKDINGIAQQLTGRDASYPTTFEILKTSLGGRALNLPGVTGSYVQTTDKAALDIVGDIDIRFEIESVADVGGNRDLLSKYDGGTQRSFMYRHTFLNVAGFLWSATGSANLPEVASNAGFPQIPNGQRVTMDIDDGSSNRVVTFYFGPAIDGPWTQFQQVVVAGITSIFASTTPLRIGARADATGTNPWGGRIRRFKLLNGINGTEVANPDFRFLAPGTPAYTDPAGNAWTYSGSAAIV